MKTFPKDDLLQSYLNTQLHVIGIKVPVQRKVFKVGYSFSALPFEEQIKIWDGIYRTAVVHEIKSQALFYISSQLTKVPAEQIWKHIKHWVKYTDNWAHSDSLSSFNSRLLEQQEKQILFQLRKWNHSDLIWERRQSVVSLLYYKKSKKKLLPFDVMIKLVECLLEDEAYYVQKGVGWTLRELWQVDSLQTEKFLNQHLHRITSIAFTAAAEKIPLPKKEKLKERRKILRK